MTSDLKKEDRSQRMEKLDWQRNNWMWVSLAQEVGGSALRLWGLHQPGTLGWLSPASECKAPLGAGPRFFRSPQSSSGD